MTGSAGDAGTAPAARRETILLLANEPDMARLVRALLGRHDVTVAASAAEAAALLGQASYGLVVLTDFGLSPEAGLGIVPEAHDYRVVFLTLAARPEIVRPCERKGVPCRTMPINTASLPRDLGLAPL